MNAHTPNPAPLSITQRVLLAVALGVAVALQTSFFSHLAWQGVVPNLCLLLVVGVALSRGPSTGMLLGFAAGLLLDLTPPADHVAGRWALALVVVGFVAGHVRTERRMSLLTTLGTIAACSFIGSSVFALSGLVVGDIAFSIPDLLTVVVVGLVWDLVFGSFIVPLTGRLLAPPQSRREARQSTGAGAR